MSKKNRKNKKKVLTRQEIEDFIKENPEAHKGIRDDGSLRCPLLSESIVVNDGFGDGSHYERVTDVQSCLMIAAYSKNISDLKRLALHENPTVSKLAKEKLEKLKLQAPQNQNTLSD